MDKSNNFLAPKGDYRNLIVYKKTECIYDLTFHFTKRFLSNGDRTVDQMVQAARSGKQNIIEGSAAATTSPETEIKLFNVAKASFDELLADYEDYLRVRGLATWPECKQKEVRDLCRSHNESSLYREVAPQRDDATIANLCITLIRQEMFLLVRLIERAKSDFLQQGGIREEMTRARLDYRKGNYSNGNYGRNGSYGSPTTPNPPTTSTPPIEK